jgi:hypothetical protein
MSIEAAARREREEFEAAMALKGYHMPPAMYRDGTYRDTDYRAGWDAWQARAALDAALPKPLDDQRLQGLFSDAISGALAFGAQNKSPPTAGHWLERFWQMGRDERALSEAPPAAEPVASLLPLKSPECWCRACDLAANPIATRMSVCPRCGDKRCDRAAHHDNACSTHFAADAAAPAVPQTEPPLDCDNPTYQRGYCDGQAYVIGTCAKFLKDGEMPHERMERDHLDTLALMGLLAAEKRKNEAPQTEKDAARYVAHRKATFITRQRLQIDGPRQTEAEFNAEYDAQCDKHLAGYVIDHRGVFVKHAAMATEQPK